MTLDTGNEAPALSSSEDLRHSRSSATLEQALEAIREKASAVRFGTITVTIHEGTVTQLEVTEKRRFGR